MSGPEDEIDVLEEEDTLSGGDVSEEADQDGGQQPEAEEQEQSESVEDDDGVVISFGDEEPSEDEESAAPEWVRRVRKENRDLRRQIAEMGRGGAEKIEIGPRPKPEDFDYDDDAYATAMEEWTRKKASADNAQREEQAKKEAAEAEWRAQLDNYGAKKSALRVPDFNDAEEEAAGRLSEVQQAIIVKGAENPAAVIYALGKHPQRLAAIASTTDPVKFAFAVAKLERDLRVTPKRKAPPPEGTVKGGGAGAATASGNRQKQIDALYAKMGQGGDVSSIRARIRELEARA